MCRAPARPAATRVDLGPRKAQPSFIRAAVRSNACPRFGGVAGATGGEEDLENSRDLTKHLAPRPFALHPQQRAAVRSTGRYGDAYVYHGWYGGSLWAYARMKETFVSELGANSLPTSEVADSGSDARLGRARNENP